MTMFKKVAGKAKHVSQKQAEDMVKKARQQRPVAPKLTEEEKTDERAGTGSKKE
jgi:hypothetical protein